LEEFLISENTLNRNLVKIFPKLSKHNKHLFIIDFICTYITEKIINEYFSDSTNYGMTQITEIDGVINHIGYNINIFKNELKEATNKAFNVEYKIPHIIFTHSELIKITKSKVSINEMEKILTVLNDTKFSGTFPLYTIPENLTFEKMPNKLKTKEKLVSLKEEKILGTFEVNKINKYNVKYDISIDNRFMIYILNNIITNHYFNISYDMYSCINLSTMSQLFLRRFILPNGFGKNTIKKINFKTIKNELGIVDKSCKYIKSKILEELQRKGYINFFYNRTTVQIEYSKIGRSVVKQIKKPTSKFRRNWTSI